MDSERATRIVLRPLATPLPLGFLGLAVGVATVSALHLGWIPASETREVALVLIVFTAPAQLLACVVGFLARDPVAATGMGVLFPAWLGAGVLLLASGGAPTSAVGVFALAVGAALLVPGAVGLATKTIAGAVVATTAVHFLLFGLYELQGGSGWARASGALGLTLAALALYAALAFELEDARRRTVLPVLRRGHAARALRAGLDTQIEHVAQEAGVREQL